MGLLSRLFGNKAKGMEFSVSIQKSTVAIPAKNVSRTTTINGKTCRIEFYGNRLEIMKINDPDEYDQDHRRWVDIFYAGEKYGYAWPEGYWTHTADHLQEKALIERWMCQELGLLSSAASPGDFKTTGRQVANKVLLAHARFDQYLIEATINPKGYVIKFEICRFPGKYNTKTSELELPERFAPLAPGVKGWLDYEFAAAKDACKAKTPEI